MGLCKPARCGCTITSGSISVQAKAGGAGYNLETYEGVATEVPDTRPALADRFDGMRVWTTDTRRMFVWVAGLGKWVILSEPWQVYAPSLGDVVLGTGAAAVNTARYRRAYSTCSMRGKLQLGVGGSFPGYAQVSVPVQAADVGAMVYQLGVAQLYDASSFIVHLADVALVSLGTSILFNPQWQGPGYDNTVRVNTPWTWGAGDNIYYAIDYEMIL